MTETRRIIGVFDEVLSSNKDFAFPSVRVWIDAPVGRDTRGLKHSFPDRGTVFLHVSACDGQHPVRNQVGLFTCVPPSGNKAEWKISNTSKHLANVIVYPTWERNPHHVAFWEWLRTQRNGAGCNILLGDGSVFVRRGRNELVGPFQFAPDGGMIPRRQIQVFEGSETIKLDIAGRTYEVIDCEALRRGRPLICDPKEAIQRRIKLASDTSHLDWLSRAKVQELSNALATLTVNDGSEWVMENLSKALEVMSASTNLDEKFSEAILQIKKVADAIEAAWKKEHAENVNKAQAEIEQVKRTAKEIQTTTDSLREDVVRLTDQKSFIESEVRDFSKKIEAAKADAGKAFEAELKRLAASPESLALLASWSGSVKGASENKSEPRIKIHRWDGERQAAANLRDALTNNLKVSRLSAPSATEVATVCSAALLSDQPISFRSIFSDLLAEAVVSSLGEPMALWADVPAGLLDPIDWDSLRAKDQWKSPLVLQGINRSDISLVLGSMRPAVYREAIGQQRSNGVLCMTLEPGKDMQIQTDFELGPVIDDRVLKFGFAKAKPGISAFAGYRSNLAELTVISDEEFVETVGEAIERLSLFTTSARRVVYRRAITGLKTFTNNAEEICRLFFKYWVLPRLPPEDVIRVLDAHKGQWEQDPVLTELAQTLTSSE